MFASGEKLKKTLLGNSAAGEPFDNICETPTAEEFGQLENWIASRLETPSVAEAFVVPR
jgi:hypothetical protein